MQNSQVLSNNPSPVNLNSVKNTSRVIIDDKGITGMSIQNAVNISCYGRDSEFKHTDKSVSDISAASNINSSRLPNDNKDSKSKLSIPLPGKE